MKVIKAMASCKGYFTLSDLNSGEVHEGRLDHKDHAHQDEANKEIFESVDTVFEDELADQQGKDGRAEANHGQVSQGHHCYRCQRDLGSNRRRDDKCD